ncbi:hypothetical protein NEFER03_0979 [Nematocida sp. LUAm3]|nr:hypothetical protein NEFER03_0979 [Nematocida sp. LUAm3]KAI5175417.1 hypothetical protein NEFER02_1346 [Nematocida sp. LUAm2]KAI5177626.1 hypothetical protein NEFER01_0850 [Nematocida sp. LUAm1]
MKAINHNLKKLSRTEKMKKMQRKGARKQIKTESAEELERTHISEESECSVGTYHNKEGEKIFRVMNIVDLVHRDANELAGIMKVKHVQDEELKYIKKREEEEEEFLKEKELFSQENIEKHKEEFTWEEKKGMLETWINNCLVCNVPLSDNSFSIFCSKCLIIEDYNLYGSI